MRTLLMALCVLLVLAAPAAAGTGTSRLGAVDQVTLTVSEVGTGTGVVTSDPAGISCGTTCSAQFAVGTTVTLTATPAAGSTAEIGSASCQHPRPPEGWKGGAGPTGVCKVILSGDTSVQATFDLRPPCIVPKVKGWWLWGAKRRLWSSNCRAGTITYAFSRKVDKAVVISQKPRAGGQLENRAAVSLVVSKGRRHAR